MIGGALSGLRANQIITDRSTFSLSCFICSNKLIRKNKGNLFICTYLLGNVEWKEYDRGGNDGGHEE